MLKTLLKNLKGTDWELLTDFVSPVFFDVVPTVAMAGAFATIARDFTSRTEFTRVKAETTTILNGLNRSRLKYNLKILDTPLPSTESIQLLSEENRIARGNLVLEIYFAQLIHCQSTLLDLRSSAFGSDQSWAPKPIFYKWDPEFKKGICNLYRGFYAGDDLLFTSGLAQLNLSHAGSIFKSHFGEGNQDQVSFSLAHFKKSFHAIFVSCKEHRTKLHPDFFALGVYLVCLYEHLEKLNVPLNVRSAFSEALSA